MAEKIKRKWNWFKIIDELAGGDILKMEAVTEQEAVFCLTYIAYKIEMNNI